MQTIMVMTLAAMLSASQASGVVTSLPPTKDNTLYQVRSDGVAPSNALGELMFAGSSGIGDIRRAIVAFDISSIPPGATIVNATLTLYNTSARTNTVPVDLHRVLADWGEGTSDATGTEGRGADPTPGDATWLHRFYPGTPWSTFGGDRVGTPSDSQPVPAAGFYSWSGPGVVADVQAWVDAPSSNHGWLLIGDEVNFGSMKWFATRDHSLPAQRPVLTVEYESAVPVELRTWGGVKALYENQ